MKYSFGPVDSIRLDAILTAIKVIAYNSSRSKEIVEIASISLNLIVLAVISFIVLYIFDKSYKNFIDFISQDFF